jgi:tetratricopeptide (TPR) repeat protein
MRRSRMLTATAVLAVVLFAAPILRAAPDREAADAAFEAGDSARGVALYDEILAEDPGDVNALLRSGMLLSWDKKYDEALARYDRALTREPDNAAVLLERGKVLLWSKRYDQAIAAFDRELRANPKQPWALCGMAQAYAWSGRRQKARPYYEKALAAQPGMKEATLGLAYLDLEDGDTSKAQERWKELSASNPTDPEVVELGKQVRRARAAWVQFGWDGASDSDENSMMTYRLEGGGALPSRLDGRLGYAHSDLGGPVPADADASGSADALYGVLGWQPRVGHRGELRLGATALHDSSGDERTAAVWGLAYSFPMAAWTGRTAVAHEPFLYSPLILDNAIDVTAFTFGASGMAGSRARIETNVGFGDFSDGNGRISADAGAWYVMSWPKRSLLLGGAVRYLDYTDDLDHGYFDPEQYVAALLSLRSDGTIDGSDWQYETAVEAGAQSFTLHGDRASHEPLWNVSGLVSRPLPHGFALQFLATFGNSSAASGPGYTSRSAGVRLRYTIGG